MIKKIKDILAQWRQEKQEATERQNLEYLSSRFQVKERNGNLYLISDGMPFKKLNPHTSANEICTLLQEARQTAIEYNSSPFAGTIIAQA